MDPAQGPKRYEPPRLPEAKPGDDSPLLVAELVRGSSYELEVGGGRGGFAFERLAAAPGMALLGFEVKKKWASLTDEKLHSHGLRGRARVYGQDAIAALPRLQPDGVFARAFLHFPDPWWKKRHAKRLVMGDPFLQQVYRLLAPGGELYIQTDVEDRADQYRSFVNAFPESTPELPAQSMRFVPAGDVAGSPDMAENPYNARSPREHRAIADGLPIWRMRWRRAS